MLTGSLIQIRQNPLVVMYLLLVVVIAWRSTKQTIFARSTMESEFATLEMDGSEVEWLKNFLTNIP